MDASTLASRLDSLGDWLVVWTLILALGVALEEPHKFVEPFKYVIDWTTLRRRFVINWWSVLFIAPTLVVAISIFGELYVDWQSGTVEQALRRVNDNTIEHLNHDNEVLEKATAEAKARLKEADAKAEKFRLDIVEAQKDAADARLETAKIEKEYAPRQLTEEQLRSFATKLSAFDGQTADVAYIDGDGEAARFASQLAQTLKEGCGWMVHGGGEMYSGELIGVIVTTAPDDRSRGVGKIVADELAADGFRRPLPPEIDSTIATGSVKILVGGKPLPPYTYVKRVKN